MVSVRVRDIIKGGRRRRLILISFSNDLVRVNIHNHESRMYNTLYKESKIKTTQKTALFDVSPVLIPWLKHNG